MDVPAEALHLVHAPRDPREHDLKAHVENLARGMDLQTIWNTDPTLGYGFNALKKWGLSAYWDGSRKAYFSAMHELGHAALGHTHWAIHTYDANKIEGEAAASMWAADNGIVEFDKQSACWLRLAFHTYEFMGVGVPGPKADAFVSLVRMYDPLDDWLCEWDSFKAWCVSSVMSGARSAAEDALDRVRPKRYPMSGAEAARRKFERILNDLQGQSFGGRDDQGRFDIHRDP